MRLRVASFVALPACGLLVACTSDLDAPDAYTEPSVSAGNGTAGTLDVDCDTFPDGAIGAEYDFTPMVSAQDDGTRTWSAANLPGGLDIDPADGRISGSPTEEGTFSIELTVIDSAGMSTSTCDIDVNAGLEVDNDLVVDTLPFCLRPGTQTLLDVVVDGTGDGTPIRCDHPSGSGNGRRPPGISVNADTCEIEGTVDDDRLGSYVFIVRGVQSGAEVWVPYCVINDEPSGYDISLDHSGLGAMNQDATLVPIVREFNPNASISVGEQDDPRFEIIDGDSCGNNSCFYGFAFQINASPFEADELSLNPNDILDDENTDPVGFFHELTISGPEVPDEFKDRPWAVNIALDYCIADNEGLPDSQEDPDNPDDGPCEGAQNVRANGDGNLDISILMLPQ